MSEQHIRDEQEMDNPFKLEGLLYYGSGSLVAIIGIIQLFTLRNSMSEDQGNGWLTLIISIFLITVGILFVVKGFQKRARFYHEEMSPLSLVTTQLESNKIFYRTEQIEQIIAERTNPTYQEGQTLHVVFYPALLTLFTFVLLVMTHAYWGEVYFISYLIYFHGEGEYEESDMTDDGIAQSNQEVKTFFRPSLSFGKMITHTHATIGDKPLSNTRYIASIEKADDLLSEWIQEMSRTLDEKRVIQGYKDMTDSTEKRNKKVAKEGSTSIQQENKNQTLEQEENDVVNDADDIKNIPSNHDIKHLENNKKEISKQEKLEDDSTPMT